MPWLESKLAEVTKMAGACRCLKKWPLFGMMMPSGNYLRDWNHQWDNEPFYPTCETPKSKDPWDSIPELNEGFLWRSIMMCGDYIYMHHLCNVWVLQLSANGILGMIGSTGRNPYWKKIQYYRCRLRKAILEVDRQHPVPWVSTRFNCFRSGWFIVEVFQTRTRDAGVNSGQRKCWEERKRVQHISLQCLLSHWTHGPFTCKQQTDHGKKTCVIGKLVWTCDYVSEMVWSQYKWHYKLKHINNIYIHMYVYIYI